MTQKKEDFYKKYGAYFQKNINDIGSKLFNRVDVVITVVGIAQPGSYGTVKNDAVYKIKGIKVINNNNDELTKNIIDYFKEINNYLQHEGEGKGYKDDANNWTMFFLLKELITKCQNNGYRFFRGQAQDWPIIPSVFRNRKNYKEKYIYQEFERVYKKISREFPDDLEYIPLSKKNIEKRADQLAILQHYGFPTALVDITSNPFIAMMFMTCFSEIKCPSLECYKIDPDSDMNDSLVTFVDKIDINKRIKAQRGAFLNFEKLKYLSKFKSKELKMNSDYKKINVIHFKIIFSEKETKRYFEQEVKNSGNVELPSKIGDTYNHYFIDNLPNSEKDYYEGIRQQLIKKLEEYGYYSNNLFPDFEDYIKYQSQSFKEKEFDKERHVNDHDEDIHKI